MRCDELLREELVLCDLGMSKTGKAGTPKDDLTKILEPETVSRGTNVFYWHTNDYVETYFMVAWKGKPTARRKRNGRTNLSIL